MKKSNSVKRILLAVICFGFIFVFSGNVLAFDSYNNAIRVHLATSSSNININVAYSVYDVLNESGAVVQTVNQGGSVTLTAGQTLSSQNGYGRFSYGGKEYRGDLVYRGGYVVNRLGMEEYIYSVVQMEIGGYAPNIEALKAQAVASRGFACGKKKTPRTAYYDVLSTTSDQAYGGYSAEDYSTNAASVSYRIREAGKATANQILYYNGALVNSIYCANTGGYSADADVVWGGNYPYLKGVSVPWDSQSFVGDNFSTDSNSSYQAVKMPTSYQWTKTFSYSDVTSKITSGSGKAIGQLTDIVIENTNGGYAKEITFVGSGGSVKLKGDQVRSYLSLRSGAFSVILGESLGAVQPFSLQYLDKANFSKFLNRSGNIVTFQGRGYGHSVGMSQWAACVMAYQGKDYWYILNYFYNQNLNNGSLTLESFKG